MWTYFDIFYAFIYINIERLAVEVMGKITFVRKNQNSAFLLL